MSNKFEKIESCPDDDSPIGALKNESARQRWQLFHRAIAYAKQSNSASLDAEQDACAQADANSADLPARGPALSVIR